MMQQRRHSVLALLAVGLILQFTSAWMPMIQNCRHRRSLVVTQRWAEEPAAAASGGEDDSAEAPAAAAEETTEGESNLVSTSVENPEVTAIKEEIAKLEEQLKQKHREIITVKDLAEEYSKVGYARKVAEMENMRRFRSVSDSLECVKNMILVVRFDL
jgi:molecular chaperone GrpE (heat shock protein)